MWFVALVVACGGGAAAEAPSSDKILAAADAHDGASDKVVSECAICDLGMAGDAAHAATHEGYTLHFCSADHAQSFQKDPAAVVTRLASVVAKGH